MTHIIISTIDPKIADLIRKFAKDNPKLFLPLFDKGDERRNGTTRILKNDGIAWTWVAALVKRYGFEQVRAFKAERMTFNTFPEIYQQGANWLVKTKNGRITYLAKNLGLTDDELKSIQVKKDLIKLKNRKV